MQNIKYCPKCQQTSTDAHIFFCPYDGIGLVEMQPIQNHLQSQIDLSIPQEKKSHSSSPNQSIPKTAAPSFSAVIKGIARFLKSTGEKSWRFATLLALIIVVGIPVSIIMFVESFNSKEVAKSTNSAPIAINTFQASSPAPDVSVKSANTATHTPTSPAVKASYKQGYATGFKNGQNRPKEVTDDTEVKNRAQVGILAQTAAELVYKPKEMDAWVFGWTNGFIAGYNKRRPNAPIR